MAKGKFAIGALIGIAAGFMTGILTAPKSGKETRTELKLKALEAKDEAIIKANEAKRKAGDVAEDVVENASKVADTVADKIVETTQDLKLKTDQAAKDARATIEKNK